MAAPAVVAVSAAVAVSAQVLPAPEPAVLAQLQREPGLVVRALLPVALVVPAELPHAVADSAADLVAVRVPLLSRQSFSAAMARSTT